MKPTNRAQRKDKTATSKAQAPKTGQGNTPAPTPAPAASDPQPERPDLAGDSNTLVHYDLSGYAMETTRIPNDLLNRIILVNLQRRDLRARPMPLGEFILEALAHHLAALESTTPGEVTVPAAPKTQAFKPVPHETEQGPPHAPQFDVALAIRLLARALELLARAAPHLPGCDASTSPSIPPRFFPPPQPPHLN